MLRLRIISVQFRALFHLHLSASLYGRNLPYGATLQPVFRELMAPRARETIAIDTPETHAAKKTAGRPMTRRAYLTEAIPSS